MWLLDYEPDIEADLDLDLKDNFIFFISDDEFIEGLNTTEMVHYFSIDRKSGREIQDLYDSIENTNLTVNLGSFYYYECSWYYT